MSMTTPPHLVADQPQARRAVTILVDSFYDDPTWACAFPDATTRRDDQRWLWRLSVDGALRYPYVWLSHDAEAVSVWIPPGGTELSSDQESELVSGLRDRLGAGADRVLRAFDEFDKHHPRDEPHFYLSLLGTDPMCLGRGIGLGLLADNLDRIDRVGAPCYLEASNPANVALYQRFGFVVHKRFEPFVDGPIVTTMWRDRRPRGRPA